MLVTLDMEARDANHCIALGVPARQAGRDLEERGMTARLDGAGSARYAGARGEFFCLVTMFLVTGRKS